MAEVDALGTMPSRGQYFMHDFWFRPGLAPIERRCKRCSPEARSSAAANASNVRFAEYTFFACLALLAVRRDPQFRGARLEASLESKLELLAGWAKSAPVNFRAQASTRSRRASRARGASRQATDLYNEAIRRGRERLPAHAGLASELAGARLCAARQLGGVAHVSRAARTHYLQWGALGKVRALDQAHPELAPAPRRSARCVPRHRERRACLSGARQRDLPAYAVRRCCASSCKTPVPSAAPC